jgi:hypothetical protein
MEKTREEKKKLAESLRGNPRVVGVGITKWGNRPAIKVNVSEPTQLTLSVGSTPVLIEVVGDIGSL